MVTVARRWDGATWLDAAMRRWDGSAWVDFHSPGPLVPQVVGTTSGGFSQSSGGDFTVPLPPGATSYIAAVTTTEPGSLGVPNGWNYIADLGGGGDYRLYHASSTPGTSWSGNYVVAVIVIGYNAQINVSTPVVSHSLTSPSVQSPGPALVLHGVADLNDSASPITFPSGDPDGRVQRVEPVPGGGWAASAAAASHSAVSSGATGTATWSVPASWQPSAWTSLITLA